MSVDFDSFYTFQGAVDAIKRKNLEDLKKHLKCGYFDVNDENEFGETLLGEAIFFRDVKIIKFLCNLDKIDVNKTFFFKKNDNRFANPYSRVKPLELAAFIMPEILYKDKPFLDPKSKEIVTELLKKGATANFEEYHIPKYKRCFYDMAQIVEYNNIKYKDDFKLSL